MPLLGRLLVGAGLLLLVLGGAACALQRRLLYFPEQAAEPEALSLAARLGLAPWRDATGALLGWRLPAAVQASLPALDGARPRLLVLHGNAGMALHRAGYLAAMAPLGVEVVLLEYPGYGARPGEPSLQALSDAAAAAVEALAAEGPGPIWLLGESLGSGVAARTAARASAQVAGLILVTPFARLAEVASLHYTQAAGLLLRDRWDPQADLAGFTGPVAVLLAGRDEVVTAAQGRRLHAALHGPRLLVEQPEATHNGLDLRPGLPFWREAVALLRAGR